MERQDVAAEEEARKVLTLATHRQVSLVLGATPAVVHVLEPHHLWQIVRCRMLCI